MTRSKSDAESRNVVYIHSHDSGRYVQPYGAPVSTPSLQRFAEDAVVFRRAFATSPACSPSRASLLTGQWPHTAAMLGLANFGFSMPSYEHHLARTLSECGLVSALTGIQHVSPDVTRIGYDQVLTPSAAGSAGAIAASAVNFVKNASSDTPFFLDVGFSETHRPYPQPSEEHDSRWLAPPPTIPDTPTTRRDMAGHLTRLRNFDRAVGQVLEALAADTQLWETTIVIITTDHGLAWPGMKLTLTDRGIGVMLMMRAPGWRAGKVIDAIVSQIDLYPTIFELLGHPAPPHVQGTSLCPLASGRTTRAREELFAETNFHVGYEPQRCIRTDRWKYIRRYLDRTRPMRAHTDPSPTRTFLESLGYFDAPYPRELLYDTMLDPQEANNLVEVPKHQDVLQSLRERLDNWQTTTEDPIRHRHLDPPAGTIIHDVDTWSPSW